MGLTFNVISAPLGSSFHSLDSTEQSTPGSPRDGVLVQDIHEGVGPQSESVVFPRILEICRRKAGPLEHGGDSGYHGKAFKSS